MGKKVKKVAEPTTPDVPVQEGDIDPYAAGKHIKNPEPNNGLGSGPKPTPAEENQPAAPGLAQPHDTPNADLDEQLEVAEGRKEK